MLQNGRPSLEPTFRKTMRFDESVVLKAYSLPSSINQSSSHSASMSMPMSYPLRRWIQKLPREENFEHARARTNNLTSTLHSTAAFLVMAALTLLTIWLPNSLEDSSQLRQEGAGGLCILMGFPSNGHLSRDLTGARLLPK